MKRFIKQITAFAGVLLVVATAIDVVISCKLMICTPPYKNWTVVYNDTTDYDIVINGSSRAYAHYDPLILDSVLGYNSYNLGIDGSPINRQIIKYNAYCRKHKSYPKLLIQNIDFIVLGVTSGYEREQFLPLFFDRELVRDVYEYEDFDLADKYIPLIRYYGYGNKIIPALRTHTDLRKGYSYGRNNPWDGTMFEQMDTVKVAHDERMIKLFDEFLSEVKSHGTDVVFVYAPIYAEVNQKCDVEMMYDMFSAIAGKYDIPILNYNEIEMCNDTNMFYNATHLNYTGSQIFSRMLAEDIDSLIGNGMILSSDKK